MSDEKRVKMTKPNGSGVTAEANVLPKDVKTWEAKGWTVEDGAGNKQGAK